MTLGLTRRASWRIDARSSTSSTKIDRGAQLEDPIDRLGEPASPRSRRPRRPAPRAGSRRRASRAATRSPSRTWSCPCPGGRTGRSPSVGDRMARRELRLGERQDDAALDDPLGLLEALELVPQARVDDPAPDLRQPRRHRERGRDLALHVQAPVSDAVVAAVEVLAGPPAVLDDRDHLARAGFGKPRLELLEQPVRHLGLVDRVRDHREAVDPADRRRRRPQGHADQLPLDLGHQDEG